MQEMEALERRLGGKRLSFFLDYDGTLAPIAGRPEDASLPFNMKVVLERLVRLHPTVVISGRSLEDVKGRVGLDGVVYAGNHGMEIEGPDFSFTYDAGRDVREEIKRLKTRLRSISRKFPGVIVEDKGVTLSIHFRLLDKREQKPFAERFREIVAPSLSRGLVRVTKGKMVFEVRPPVDWHKGRAVEWILERPAFSETLPLYMGDDETDRDGFRALKGRGISVFVGGVSEETDYFIRRQVDVKNFLRRICQVS